ncbi:hypothetical protein EDD21DRAFT_103922 [Dissophora ornata]|nr:hypothetical protein EDD21DRAFT_103922 [Dissophora ornata]
MSSSSSPVLEAVKSPDGSVGVYSPRVGPSPNAADSLSRMERSPSSNPSRNDKSPMINPTTRIEKSPMLNSTRTEKSPLLVPASMFVGEELSGNAIPIHADITKPNVCLTQQLLVEVERLPKRLLQKLKQRPELASIEWTEDTVDLSAMWSSPEPIPTYEEHVGISDIMKTSNLYPNHLNDVDVLEIRLMLGMEEPRDIDAKNRARRWDLLEMRVDQELDNGEKWIKEISNWSQSKATAIERHQRSDESKGGSWLLDGNSVLVEEPEAEDSADTLAPQTTLDVSEGDKNSQISLVVPVGTLQARKQRRGLSLSSARYTNGSMSSVQTSLTYNFKDSMETTREAVDEMRVYIVECRQRLRQLHDATGSQLREKEPVFKEVVDKFTMEWNESYFVKLKEVEDQIQVMNLKRIENPWMDMLLIMLSWFIRGLFYIVEAVTIMIIVVRHGWGMAKKGCEVIRNARREQQRLSHSGGGGKAERSAAGSIPNGAPIVKDLASGDGACTGVSSGNSEANVQPKTVGAQT